jgi:hypothetical protein
MQIEEHPSQSGKIIFQKHENEIAFKHAVRMKRLQGYHLGGLKSSARDLEQLFSEYRAVRHRLLHHHYLPLPRVQLLSSTKKTVCKTT